jgi:hypothetical protein
LRYKEFELEFGRELFEAERAAITIRPSPPETPTEPVPLPRHLESMAATAPSAAIFEAWCEIEAAAIAVAAEHGISVTGGSWQVFVALGSQGVIDPGQAALANRLWHLRNRIAYIPDDVVNEEHARRYLAVARRLVEILRTLRRPGV